MSCGGSLKTTTSSGSVSATNGRYEVPMLDEFFMDELHVWADDGGAH